MKYNNYSMKKYGSNYVISNGCGNVWGSKEDVVRIMKLHVSLNKDNQDEENIKTIRAFEYFIKKLEVA